MFGQVISWPIRAVAGASKAILSFITWALRTILVYSQVRSGISLQEVSPTNLLQGRATAELPHAVLGVAVGSTNHSPHM